MSVSVALLRRFETRLGREVKLCDGRTAILRIVDGYSGKIDLCIELPSGLVWVEPDQLQLPDEEGKRRAKPERGRDQ